MALTKAGYLGMECDRKKPLVAVGLNAMSPLLCAKEELVYPVGFSSFQATCSRAPELMSSRVLVRAVLPMSTLMS